MAKRASSPHPHAAAISALRAFGLTYPKAFTKSPWPGHLDLAVADKTFAFLGVEGEPLHMTCKLPKSGAIALHFPFAAPAQYGLAKSGWVSVTFASSETPPVSLLKEWIDESYRAQAPKRLIAQLDGKVAPGANAAKKPAVKNLVAKKTAAKKSSPKIPSAKKPTARKPPAAKPTASRKRA